MMRIPINNMVTTTDILFLIFGIVITRVRVKKVSIKVGNLVSFL